MTTMKGMAAEPDEERPTRKAHRRFHREVASLLHRAGFPLAGRDPVSGLVTLTATRSVDVNGDEPSWGLDLHAGRDHRAAEHLDAVTSAADAAGLRWCATVQRRFGRDTAASYVTLTLDQFVQLLQRLEPAACTKPSARWRAELPMDGVH